VSSTRVFIRGGVIYLQTYTGNDRNRRVSTRIKTTIKQEQIEGDPQWWKKLKDAPKIRAKIKELDESLNPVLTDSLRTSGFRGWTDEEAPALDELLEEWNEHSNARRAVSKGQMSDQTLRRRKHSLDQVLKFDSSATIESINTEAWIKRFRKSLQDREMTAWTQISILSDIKGLSAYAAKRKYIPESAFADLKLGTPESQADHTPLSQEKKFFKALFAANRDLFRQAMFQRLTGVRFQDASAFTMSAIGQDEGKLDPLPNLKAGRMEKFPITKAIGIVLFDLTDEYEPYAFRYREENYAAENKYIGQLCKKLEIPKIQTHQLKRNYIHELEEVEMKQHIFELLKHHAAKSLTVRYTGTNINAMRVALEKAQEHWVEFLTNLYKL